MGHITETRRGVGKTKAAAWQAVCDEYRSEYGYSHEIREVETATFVSKIPPMKPVKRIVRVGQRSYERIDYEPNPLAPMSEWSQEWVFEFDVHI